MPLSAVDPTTSFPHEALTPIVGKPTFAQIQGLKQEMISNAVSVHSQRGNGALGHAVIVLGQVEYNALVGPANHWVQPPNPGPQPIIPANATQHMILAIQSQWERDTREWETYFSTEKALKRLLLQAIDKTYISSLADPLFGYTNVSVHQILRHLETTYAALDPDALFKNLEELRSPWEPAESMEPLWQRGVNAQRMATAGGEPITDGTLLMIFRDILKNTGVFTLDLRDWDRLPAAQKTLANFQTTFTEANKERIKNLTTDEYSRSGTPTLSTPPRGSTFSAIGNSKGPVLLCKPTGTKLAYCWSHGVSTNEEHNSMTCTRKASGHQDDATIDDMKGGNNTIRRKPREKNVYKEKNPTTPKRKSGEANSATITQSSSTDSASQSDSP